MRAMRSLLVALHRRSRYRAAVLRAVVFVGGTALLLSLMWTSQTGTGGYLLGTWSLTSLLRRAAPPTPKPRPSDAELLALVRNASFACGDIQALFSHRIPPVVHWTNKDDRVLQPHQDFLRSWTQVLGSSMAYMYWTDSRAEELIKRHYQAVWKRYQRLSAGIMRSDIARLAIVHHTGGVYADLDVKLLRSLHPLMLGGSSAVWSQEPQEHIYFMYQRGRLLSNAFFMSRARHPFLQFVLDAWPAWFDAKWASQNHALQNADNAVHVTGPLMLNEFLDRYENRSRLEPGFLADPDTFQPTWDTWYARMVAQRVCPHPVNSMPANAKALCEVLKARQYRTRDVTNASYTVHKYLHTSYGKGANSFVGAKFARDILPLTHCTV